MFLLTCQIRKAIENYAEPAQDLYRDALRVKKSIL